MIFSETAGPNCPIPRDVCHGCNGRCRNCRLCQRSQERLKPYNGRKGALKIPIAKQERPVELAEMVEQIKSQADFLAFSRALLKDLKDKPEGWENWDLPAFLEEFRPWVEDMNGYCQAKGGAIPLQPGWKMIGQILLAAKVYE